MDVSLLLCHEIDSAIWREWELFHLPGGATGFVAMHLALVPLVLLGLLQIVTRRPASRWLALLVGLGGLAGALVHATFLVLGDQRFATVFSTALIVAFGLSSVALVAITLRNWRPAARPRALKSSAPGEPTRRAAGPR